MENTLAPLLATYDYFQQPVFFARDGAVFYSNRPARDLFVHPGASLSALLGDSEAFLPRTPQSAPVQMPLTLTGKTMQASVHPFEDGLLFILTAAQEQAVPPQALQAVAQALRTPLSNLFGVASSLFPALEDLEDPVAQQNVAALERAFYQLLHITCDLSVLPGVLDGSLRLAREKTEMCGFLYEIFEKAEPLFRLAKISLSCELPDSTFSAWIDRQMLSRAIWNLLSNAVKFTPRDGSVRLTLSYTQKTAVLRVEDSGEGMDPGLLSGAFTRFGDRMQPGDPRWGIGFGLQFVRCVAQKHGGTSVMQTQPGEGTSVIISLPLEAPAPRDPQLASPILDVDYTGGYRHELVELADVLPLDVFRFL